MDNGVFDKMEEAVKSTPTGRKARQSKQFKSSKTNKQTEITYVYVIRIAIIIHFN